MSLETAQKVIVLQKKNYVPHFLKQRDINSYLHSLQPFLQYTETFIFTYCIQFYSIPLFFTYCM